MVDIVDMDIQDTSDTEDSMVDTQDMDTDTDFTVKYLRPQSLRSV